MYVSSFAYLGSPRMRWRPLLRLLLLLQACCRAGNMAVVASKHAP